MIKAKESFGIASELYKQGRPSYSSELFEVIKLCHPNAQTIWDVGTGNGQAANGLAQVFDKINATDISPNQIDQSIPSDKIYYAVAPAENSGLEPNSIDLITSAAAIHWFDPEGFIDEAQRVSRSDPQLAFWSYRASPKTDDQGINQTMNHILYHELGRFWSDESRYGDNLYVGLPLIDKLDGVRIIDFDTIASKSYDSVGIKSYIESLSPSIAYHQQCGNKITDAFGDYIDEMMSDKEYNFVRNGRLYLATI